MYNNIPLLIKYYKEGKISEFTLCSELSELLSDENYANIILTKDTVSATNSSFVAALMPEKGNNGLKVNYVIDKKAVASDIVTDEDVANCLLALKANAQNILAAYIKELNQVKMVDFSLGDAVLVYSKIFRMSVMSFPEEFKAKAKEINLIKYDEIDDAITKMQTDMSDVNQTIECLLVNDLIPDVFIETAKEMVTNQTKTRIVIGDNLPSTNIMQNKFGHTPEEDDIFSGGVQIKEKLNESNHEVFKGNRDKFNKHKPSKKIRELDDDYNPNKKHAVKDKSNKHKKNLAQYDPEEDEDYVDYRLHEEFTLDLKDDLTQYLSEQDLIDLMEDIENLDDEFLIDNELNEGLKTKLIGLSTFFLNKASMDKLLNIAKQKIKSNSKDAKEVKELLDEIDAALKSSSRKDKRKCIKKIINQAPEKDKKEAEQKLQKAVGKKTSLKESEEYTLNERIASLRNIYAEDTTVLNNTDIITTTNGAGDILSKTAVIDPSKISKALGCSAAIVTGFVSCGQAVLCAIILALIVAAITVIIMKILEYRKNHKSITYRAVN